MFNQTKYTKIYFRIINNAKERELVTYTEKHHIIPKSLGGTNSIDNLVKLTAREHFICHWLLTKMVNKLFRPKMMYALYMMRSKSVNHKTRYSTKITAKVYEKYKREHAENSRNLNKGKTPKNKGKKLEGIELEKQRARTKNRRKLSPEENAVRIAKIVATNTGRKQSQETKDKISKSLTGKKKEPKSEIIKNKISTTLTGKSKSTQSVEKRRETLKKLASNGTHHTQIILVCPYCNIKTKKLNYSRWHGDKCKLKL